MLGRFTDEQHRAAALASLIDADREPEPEPADVERARRAVVQLQIELDRVMASLRAGRDPDLVANPAKGIQREMAQARITTWEAAHPGEARIDEGEIAAALKHAGGLAALVTGCEREPRARLYRALGLDLLLDPVGDPPTIRARLQLCGGGGPQHSIAATLALAS